MSGLFSPATGTLVRTMGLMKLSVTMPLFQGPSAEEGLAATAAAREAEGTVSTGGEAGASSVPTEGLTLSMSTKDPGEEVTPVRSSECMLHGISSGDGGRLRRE